VASETRSSRAARRRTIRAPRRATSAIRKVSRSAPAPRACKLRVAIPVKWPAAGVPWWITTTRKSYAAHRPPPPRSSMRRPPPVARRDARYGNANRRLRASGSAHPGVTAATGCATTSLGDANVEGTYDYRLRLTEITGWVWAHPAAAAREPDNSMALDAADRKHPPRTGRATTENWCAARIHTPEDTLWLPRSGLSLRFAKSQLALNRNAGSHEPPR
jgi:hypothetical protein